MAAFFVGSSWAVILFIYGDISDADMIPRYEGTSRSAIRVGFDTAFVGGGTGVVLYITKSFLSAFRYGLAGMVSAFIAVTLAAKFRSKY